MDITQPACAIVTYHADSHGGFYTTSLFWDCSCDEHYIHLFSQPDCPACGDCREEAPETRLYEVLGNTYEWRLDKVLVHHLEEVFPCCALDMVPGEDLLVEQHEIVCRMQDNVWIVPDSLPITVFNYLATHKYIVKQRNIRHKIATFSSSNLFF